MSRTLQADHTFLRLLAEFTEQGRHVSSTKSANYAPALFAESPSAQGVSKAALGQAMNRLFDAGRIKVEEFGPPSRRLKRIVEASSDTSHED